MAKAKRELKVLLNIGRDDEKRYGIPLAKEDEVVAVTDEQAHVMVNVLKVAKDYDAEEEAEHRQRIAEFDDRVLETEVAMLQHRMKLEAEAKQRMESAKARVAGRPLAGSTVRSQADASDTEDESPVASVTVPEAVESIRTMRSKDKLQAIVNSDKRAGVTEAAQKRLAELG